MAKLYATSPNGTTYLKSFNNNEYYTTIKDGAFVVFNNGIVIIMQKWITENSWYVLPISIDIMTIALNHLMASTSGGITELSSYLNWAGTFHDKVYVKSSGSGGCSAIIAGIAK